MEIVFFSLSCCGLLFGVVIGLLIGSVILRAAVALANRILGPESPPDTFGQWDDWDSDEPGPRAQKGRTRTVPEPSLAIGGVVTFATGIASVLGYMTLVFIAEEFFHIGGPDEEIALVLIFILGLPGTATALALILMVLLPTTFRRAALVAFVHHFLTIVGGGVIAVVVLFAWALLVG